MSNETGAGNSAFDLKLDADEIVRRTAVEKEKLRAERCTMCGGLNKHRGGCLNDFPMTEPVDDCPLCPGFSDPCGNSNCPQLKTSRSMIETIVRSEAAEQDRIDRLIAEVARNEVIARNIVRQARYVYADFHVSNHIAWCAMEEEYVRLIAKALTGEAKI